MLILVQTFLPGIQVSVERSTDGGYDLAVEVDTQEAYAVNASCNGLSPDDLNPANNCYAQDCEWYADV